MSKLIQFTREIRGMCSDMGTELAIPGLQLSVKELLPPWMKFAEMEVGQEQADLNEFEPALPPAAPDPGIALDGGREPDSDNSLPGTPVAEGCLSPHAEAFSSDESQAPSQPLAA